MNKDRILFLSGMILLAAAARLLPHAPNFTPVAAIALFGGAQFERKWLAFAVPLAALLLSDLVIGFYDQMWVTYLAFAAIVGIGFALRGHVRAWPIIGASFAGSVLFFLVTNFALWLPYDLYPKTAEGVATGYAAALPFFVNTAIGDLFYNVLLFGGFAAAERKYSRLRLAPAPL